MSRIQSALEQELVEEIFNTSLNDRLMKKQEKSIKIFWQMITSRGRS